jgi:hypothetical protein
VLIVGDDERDVAVVTGGGVATLMATWEATWEAAGMTFDGD